MGESKARVECVYLNQICMKTCSLSSEAGDCCWRGPRSGISWREGEWGCCEELAGF